MKGEAPANKQDAPPQHSLLAVSITETIMSPAFEALFWGFISGGALVLGAAVGFLVNVPSRVVAAIMAFGSGVLISALSFELMGEAFE